MKLIASSLLLFALACTPKVIKPIDPRSDFPTDSAQVCTRHCQSMSLELAAVVLVSNRVGCVCAPAAPPMSVPAGAPGSAMLGGVSTAASAVAIVVDEEAAAAQQQRNAQTHVK